MRRPGDGGRQFAGAARAWTFALAAAALWWWGAPGAEGRIATVRILATTDMHGNVRPTPGRYLEHHDGGMLKVAAEVKRLRAENPETLLVDSGDVFQGTAESLLAGARPVIRIFNAMGYDAWAVGNHEFDWGVAELERILSEVEPTPLAANLSRGEAGGAFGKIRDWTVAECDGVRVGIAGLTNPNLNQWFGELAGAGLHAYASDRALERVLGDLNEEGVQVKVLLLHQGLRAQDDAANQVNAIGRWFGEFDVALGGHLHYLVPEGLRVGHLDYVQAGSGARGVLEVQLDYDTVERRVTAKRYAWHPVTGPDAPEDAELAAAVAGDLATVERELAKKVGRAAVDIPASHAVPGESPVQQLLCRAIAEETGAEVVLHGLFSLAGLAAGDVTVEDVWRLVPYENRVMTAWLTPEDLRAILEEDLEFWGKERYFGTWGLEFEVHPKEEAGRRVKMLRGAGGRALHGRQRILVAFGSYHASGGGGRFPELERRVHDPRARLQDSGVRLRDCVMRYFRKHRSVAVEAGRGVRVVK